MSKKRQPIDLLRCLGSHSERKLISIRRLPSHLGSGKLYIKLMKFGRFESPLFLWSSWFSEIPASSPDDTRVSLVSSLVNPREKEHGLKSLEPGTHYLSLITMPYDPGTELARWGLRLLEGDKEDHNKYIDLSDSSFEFSGGSTSNSGYNSHISEYNVIIQHDPYSSCNFETEITKVENDEIIALTLQEELSQLAVAEASELNGSKEKSECVYQQDWHNPSTGEYYSGHKHGWEDGNGEMVPSRFFSSTGENYQYEEEYPYSMDASDLDGEVSKRLNQMFPVPHVPKINGELPSSDDATSDYERLVHRLKVYNLLELKVQGDGNCQFRALSDQLYRTPEHHNFVRQQIVKQLQSHPEIYQGYVPMTFGEYLKKMSKSGEWGDHLTLQAAADSYGIIIVVLTSFKDTCYIEILPEVQKSKRVIYLSFWAEVHYNSIYPEGDTDSDIPLFK